MHFTGWLAAATCDEPGKAITADLVGAKHEHEVAIMNGLSVNLRLGLPDMIPVIPFAEG